MKQKIISLILALVVFIAAAPEAYADMEGYVALTDGVDMEMMSADYWLGKKNEQAYSTNEPLMTEEEIESANALNSAMISYNGERLALADCPETVSGDFVRGFIASASVPSNPSARFLNGEATTEEYWNALDKNRALAAVPDTVSVRFGFSVRRASLRLFPSSDFVGGTAEDRLYDKLVMSEFMPYLPLAVLHESADGEWYYVLMYGFGGWVEKKNVALCTSRGDWTARIQENDFLVVTGRELHLPEEPYCPAVSGLILPMGTKLPLVRLSDAPESVNRRKSYGCYVVKLPTRGDDGYILDEYALVSTAEDVSLGFLPYTLENELELAFKLLGDRYGWAGMYGANDCSGIVHEIFSCFGLALPRTASAIMELEGFEKRDMSGMSDSEKLAVLEKLPSGSLLGFTGHIMIYLGIRGGEAYVISAVGSFGGADADADTDYAVNSVTVNALSLSRRRSTGTLWIESLDSALSLG